jgi:hypothetical protein
MNSKHVTWEDFKYRYLDTGLVDYHRTRTVKALERLFNAMSQEDLDSLPRLLIVFAPPTQQLGEAIPWVEPGIEQSGFFIYLAPQLERKSQAEVDSTVAHEFAHAILLDDPTPTHGVGPEERLSRQADLPSDVKADELVQKWGFAPAYRRSKRKRTEGSGQLGPG